MTDHTLFGDQEENYQQDQGSYLSFLSSPSSPFHSESPSLEVKEKLS